MREYKAILEADTFYHIYNRANGSEKLFLNDDNYSYFLQKYAFYISPIADTFAYCLMPNHFHFVVRVKGFGALSHLQGFEKLRVKSQTSDVLKTSDVSATVSEAFRRLFMSYTKAYNKQKQRKGSLFIPRFNRIKITNEEYLKNVINYVHQNPVSHGYVKELDDWKYSSYTAFAEDKTSKLNKQEVYELFDDKANFVAYHNMKKAEHFALKMDLAY